MTNLIKKTLDYILADDRIAATSLIATAAIMAGGMYLASISKTRRYEPKKENTKNEISYKQMNNANHSSAQSR